MRRIRAVDIFDDEQITQIEQWVMKHPEPRKFGSRSREFPRFVSLPSGLEQVAMGALTGTRSCQLDVIQMEILFNP